MVARLFLLLALLLLSSALLAKELIATVDRKQLGYDEQLALTVTLSGTRGQRPDTAGLLKDFSIERQTQSTNFTVVNGVASYKTSWAFLLSPNRKGALTIPALTSGRFSSQPIAITVTDMPVAQSTSDDVLMEVELSPSNPYVQSQVTYVQRLYFSRRLVDNASISSPKLSQGDADIQFWGSSDPRYVTHNNRPYQLIERYYVVYPRKPGVLEFEPSVFKGSLASSQQRSDRRMNGSQMRARVNAYSEKAAVEVREKPASYTGENWLPATQLTLSVNISQPPETLRVGEPVTVTIALMAKGLKAEVLPELKLAIPDAIKSYPEKPVFRTDEVSNGLVGLRQEKIVLVANAPGEYLIPQLEIPWWSVTEDKPQLATFDAIVLNVAPGDAVLPNQNDSSATESTIEFDKVNDKPVTEGELGDESSDEAPVERHALLTRYQTGLSKFYEQHRQVILIALPVTLGLFIIGVFAIKRRKSHVASEPYQHQLALDKALSDLTVACQKNDRELAIAALPSWADAVGIYPSTIAGIEAEGDAPLSLAVRALAGANYSPHTISWRGESLLSAVKQFSRRSSLNNSARSGLKPLHPVVS